MSTENKEPQNKEGNDVTEVTFDITNPETTLEQFEEQLKTDSALKDEYLSDPHNEKFEKFNTLFDMKRAGNYTPGQQLDSEKKGDGEGGAVGSEDNPLESGSARTQEGDTGESTTKDVNLSDEEEVLEIKIPKSLLGTYLKGREAPDAVLEALKGKGEADRTIRQLIEEKREVFDDNLSLRQRLIELQNKKAETPPAPSAGQQLSEQQQEVEDVDYLKEFDDLDPLDEDDWKKGRKLLEKAAKRQKVQPPSEKKPDQTPEQETTVEDSPEVKQGKEELRNAVHTRNFMAIKELQMAVPELQTSVDFQILNQQVDQFFKNIGIVGGSPGDHMKAVNTYFSDTPQGQLLRETCEKQGVKKPDGYDTHQKITRLFTKREKDISGFLEKESKRIGRPIERYEFNENDLPNSSFFDYYLRERGSSGSQQAQQQPPPGGDQQPSSQLQQTIQKHEQQQTAPPKGATEVPAGVGDTNKNLFNGITEAQLRDLTALAVANPMNVTVEQAKYLVELFEKMREKTPELPIPPKLIERSKG
jgi:hypothetical protein